MIRPRRQFCDRREPPQIVVSRGDFDENDALSVSVRRYANTRPRRSFARELFDETSLVARRLTDRLAMTLSGRLLFCDDGEVSAADSGGWMRRLRAQWRRQSRRRRGWRILRHTLTASPGEQNVL